MSLQMFDYSQSGYQIRSDMAAAYRDIWWRIARPGNWWTGAQREAILREARASRECDLCQEKAQALSPSAVSGDCGSTQAELLPQESIDAIHRISNDAARLTSTWLEGLIGPSFGYGHYVELIGVLVAARSIDAFHEALGLNLEPLPKPEEGAPSGYLPKEANFAGAWVPVLNGESLAPQDADIYAELPPEYVPVPNVLSAMSLVPDAVRMLFRLSAVQYLDMKGFMRFEQLPGRVLSRSQVELVAARVSALNDCFY